MSKSAFNFSKKSPIYAPFKFLWLLIKTVFFKLYDAVLFRIENSRQKFAHEVFEDTPSRTSIFRKGIGHIKIVLQLASIIIKADGEIKKGELEFVRQKIAKDFTNKTADAWVARIEKHLLEFLDLEELIKKVNRIYSQSTKIQLLHFLAGIAVKDAMLTSKELQTLQKIAMKIRIPYKTLISILALYDFITEEQAEKNRKRKSKPVESPEWHLKRAFIILEIPSTATDREIKKRYRKLAKLHHPDRVLHMGLKFQKQAEEKFKQIAEAYQAIKNSRGIT